ncbi:hypothetical protein Ahy_A01g003144 [Arachis hypogaea]|uniref:SWIM-type domain-containing protein n=1 Tax=Arachis hypogaea TaxID=3818 RepID=A0A445ESC0_ARAHY|nr:hypothetical protein Ahy_A01g003144 [Arachis hypogaea]
MSYFSVKIYHQGRFRLEGGCVRYLGGETSIVDYCDEDEWRLIEVYEIVSRRGYLKKDIAAMWYKAVNAGLDEGLTMLKINKDAMNMARIGLKTSEVGEVVQPGQITAPVEKGDQAGPSPIIVYEGPGVGLGPKTATDGPTEVEEVGFMSEGSCEVVRSSDAVKEEEEGSETSEDNDYEPRGVKVHGLLTQLLGMHQFTVLREGAEGLVDVNITEEREKESTPNQSHGQSSQPAARNLGKEKIVGGFGDEDAGHNSEDFLDIPFSDDENDTEKRYPIHRPLKNMSEYTWEVETLYVSREEFKDCATAYAVSSGKGLRFTKVDLKRVKVECVEGCEWYAYCGKMKHERSWQLKSCNNKHNCSRELKIGIMHAKWMSKVFLNKIIENPKIKLTTLMRKAYTKVRQFALDELQGTYVEQYRKLYDYCHELLKTNPGSSKVDQGAYNYLMEIPTKYWCRHRFECRPRYDTLVNNMCEVFNSVLVEAREKPIVTMLEDIWVYIMKRCANNRDRIVLYNRDVLPRIRIKVEKQAKLSGNWVSVYAGRDRYGVVSIQRGKEKIVVDLRHHECSCRKFQLSGIHCAHAMTCIRKMCFNVDTYVTDYYKKAAYISCYQHVVFPVNGPNLWNRTQFEDVLPPIYRKPIGRPKKKRARGADEQATRTGLSREGQQQKCSYCLCSGHNKRSYPKKRKVTRNPIVNNVATSTSKGRSWKGVRKSFRLSTKTASGKATESESRKQKGNNNKPPSHPKRKPAVSSQQSQAASKKTKVDHLQTASAPAPTTPTVLPSPMKRVSQSQLMFMARTPPRAWKNVE